MRLAGFGAECLRFWGFGVRAIGILSGLLKFKGFFVKVLQGSYMGGVWASSASEAQRG